MATNIKLLKLKFLINPSFLAGFLIGICMWLYTAIENKYIGALLFSFGLTLILVKKYKLFTGSVGFLLTSEKPNKCKNIIFILFANLLGTATAAFLSCFAKVNENNIEILLNSKLEQSYLSLLIMSMICGIVMYLSVCGWLQTKNHIIILLGIMLFIMLGAEHCIANSYLIFFILFKKSQISLSVIKFLIINIIGNSIGAICWNLLEVE